jgi:hypothetical protein
MRTLCWYHRQTLYFNKHFSIYIYFLIYLESTPLQCVCVERGGVIISEVPMTTSNNYTCILILHKNTITYNYMWTFDGNDIFNCNKSSLTLAPSPECTHSDHNSTVYVAGEDSNTTKPLRRNLNNSDGSYINFK